MKNALIILLCIASAALRAVAAPDVVLRADSLYLAGAYQQAAEAYSAAIDSLGARNADMYYNLGNAQYRTGHPGRAIVSYHRALRLDPRHPQARANLEFLNSRIIDRPGPRGTVVSQARDTLIATMAPNAWAWTALGLFVLTLAAVAVYCFTSPVPLRKAGFFSAIPLFVLTCIAIGLAVHAASRATATDEAVVVVPSTILSTAPREPRNRAEEAMLLHEGTTMRILDSLQTTTDTVPSLWYDVEVDNTHRAWINASAVERI